MQIFFYFVELPQPSSTRVPIGFFLAVRRGATTTKIRLEIFTGRDTLIRKCIYLCQVLVKRSELFAGLARHILLEEDHFLLCICEMRSMEVANERALKVLDREIIYCTLCVRYRDCVPNLKLPQHPCLVELIKDHLVLTPQRSIKPNGR